MKTELTNEMAILLEKTLAWSPLHLRKEINDVLERYQTIELDELIENAECDTGNDLDQIGFSISNDRYEVNFYGDRQFDYLVGIESFFNLKTKNHVTPTERQISRMKEIIYNKADEIQKQIDYEESLIIKIETEEEYKLYKNDLL